ncbi:MAG: PLP-dependent aminotransferase family protein [Eubacterium sp.]|nr:PLP-dependent aminotransferase family protein [Eubacterium sp.]
MLTYSLTKKGTESLYMHLYDCMKQDILEGTLKPGEKLPSKRSFAKNLGVSNITVENAYGQLQAEGFIFSKPKKGYYVTKLPDSAFLASKQPKVSGNAAVTANMGMTELSGREDSRIDLVSNKTNPDNFPFSIWAKLMREVISAKSEALMQKSPAGGIPELRGAICMHLKQFRNMEVDPEQVIVGAGTEYLYSLLIQLLGFDKVYALEEPGYRKIAQIYESNQVVCEHIPLDGDGMAVEELEKHHADVAHISPSHHYPTGIVTPVSRRYELLGWAAREESRFIIEDDYDSEFRLSGKPLPTLQSIDVAGKVIYMNTFTKSLAATIRISYMVLPKPLLREFTERLGFYSCTVSNFEQYTLAKFIRDGYLEKHINRMRNYYRGLRNAFVREIAKSGLSRICTIREEEAGLHFLLCFRTDYGDRELTDRCRKAGLYITALSQYYIREEDQEDSHTLIVNYSGLKKEDIETTVALLNGIFS